MKRLIAITLMLVLAFTMSACSDANKEDTMISPDVVTLQTEQPSADSGTDEVEATNKIGFALAGDNSFTQQFEADINTECSALGYEAVVSKAMTAEEQNTQIRTMISDNVNVIVLQPVDVDELEAMLAECETHGIPVIDIVESINGLVSTLITPDYLAIGKSAGRDAVELFGDSDGQCMIIKTKVDSFSMQLMTDGFIEEINKDKDVTLVGEEYCGSDEEKAYEAAKAAITGREVDFIFAQSDVLAKGALRAIEDRNSDIKLVAFGGDMELISAAVDGRIHSCIFFGTNKLAEETMYIADRLMKNPAYLPEQYVEVRIEAAQEDGAAQYYVDGGLYAQTAGE